MDCPPVVGVGVNVVSGAAGVGVGGEVTEVPVGVGTGSV